MYILAGYYEKKLQIRNIVLNAHLHMMQVGMK